jgi:hypothetical protein
MLPLMGHEVGAGLNTWQTLLENDLFCSGYFPGRETYNRSSPFKLLRAGSGHCNRSG